MKEENLSEQEKVEEATRAVREVERAFMAKAYKESEEKDKEIEKLQKQLGYVVIAFIAIIFIGLTLYSARPGAPQNEEGCLPGNYC